MATSRRRFLVLVGLAAAGAVAGWRARLGVARWLFVPPLPAAPVGALRDSTAGTLDAVVRALLGDRAAPGPYVANFRWRAEHVPGDRALYERFEAAIDRAARRAGRGGFRDAAPDLQRRILAPLTPARGAQRLRRALLARDEERWSREVVRRVFRRFARTDAYVAAGYATWPGTPRAISRLDGRGGRS